MLDETRMPPVKIALIGDRNERVTAHVAISLALDFAARQMDRPVTWQWLDTDVLSSVVARDLAGFSGVWCVPASPYRNMENALSAIRWARENKVPFLGTCGGYQHAIIEFARNVLGLAGAGSTEIDPDTQLPLISPLSCALIEQSDGIVFSEDSAIAKIHDGRRVHEKYHCSYGINPEFIGLLDGQKLSICGWDEHDEPKAVELKDHPFFFGTAYQPERSALSGQTHPLIIAFVQAAARHAERGDAGRAAVEASATGSETG